MTKKQASGVATKAKGQIKITGEGRYPLVPLLSIKLVERPAKGEESSKVFYNPRDLDSFTPQEMEELCTSIQEDGLQQPPIVRVFTEGEKKDGKITRIELVAGERRFRSIMKLYEQNAPCYDDETGDKISARKLYEHLPCKVLYNIDDWKALRVAFLENNEHRKLTTQEEISLVERLMKMGMRQDEISEKLKTNVTWVSQTGNFRTELPPAAFEKLVSGKLSRHVAVKILSYKPEDRAALFAHTVKAEKEDTERRLGELDDEIAQAEDLEDIEANKAQKAIKSGNGTAAKRHTKKAAAAGKKAAAAAERKGRVVEETGTIRQGHLSKGGMMAGVAPKKAQMLNRVSLEQFFIDLPEIWLTNGKIDVVTKQKMPPDVLEVMVATAKAIHKGESDPGKVVRTIMVERGKWSLPEGYVEEESEPLDE